MKQNKARKLNLGKKTISQLNVAESKAMNGGSISVYTGGTSIVVYTNGCGSDFTRPRTSVMTGGPVGP